MILSKIGGITGAAGGVFLTHFMMRHSTGGTLEEALVLTTCTIGVSTVIGATFPVSIPLIGCGLFYLNKK